MPSFNFIRRKAKTRMPTAALSTETPRTNVGAVEHHTPVERRIHPDLNSLAEALTPVGSTCEMFEESHRSFQQTLPDPSQSDTGSFVGLEPSTRRRSQQEECRQDKRTLNSDPPLGPDGIVNYSQGEVLAKANNKEQPIEKAQVIESTASDTYFSFSSATRPLPDPDALRILPMDTTSHTTSLTRWPTFGRRNRYLTRASTGSTAGRSAQRTESQSSLSQPRSRATSQSYFTSEDHQPRTPRSQAHSLYTSTPYSPRRVPSSPNDADRVLLSSPHTFGMPTPPHHESEQGLRREGSYFSFKELPPPLPPLDHPAFREPVDEFGVSRRPHPLNHVGGSIATRHSYSLPSLTSTAKTTKLGATKGTQRRSHARGRSKSIVGAGTSSVKNELPLELTRRIFHSRNQSKSSIASSRRSSAEYSAKQASSIDHGGCWEVDVTKAMISLALGEGQRRETRTVASPKRGAYNTTFPGKARGNNRASGEGGVALDTPFSLQDPLPDKIRDNQFSNDHHARLEHQRKNESSKKVEETSLRPQIMSNGESMAPTSSASANTTTSSKGKEVSSGGGSISKGSHSRRVGTRSDSSTRTSPLAKAETESGSLVGSTRGQTSLLAPPLLSVTAPTPGSSPISPTRRKHLKSTPSMPTKSVLRTPSTPAAIEKSYSSGSGKRKAEEAGVGGDKTPPKEQRATSFAPEPRTHRASATSNSNSSGHAPSSFNRSKRVRLTDSSEGGRSTLSATDESPPNAKNTGSWSSKGSQGPMSASSHAHTNREQHSYRDGPPIARSASRASHGGRAPSRRSLSQASIPLSALVSPHAPSVARSGTFHMRDPRKPPPVQSTPWSLSLPSHLQAGESRWDVRSWVERGGSPLHAWLFFIGFVIFPLWWAAALCIPIPRTRRLGGTDSEKGVMLDDPQVEHDAKSWRTRCRVMAAVSFLTYIPFIVLVAIFA